MTQIAQHTLGRTYFCTSTYERLDRVPTSVMLTAHQLYDAGEGDSVISERRTSSDPKSIAKSITPTDEEGRRTSHKSYFGRPSGGRSRAATASGLLIGRSGTRAVSRQADSQSCSIHSKLCGNDRRPAIETGAEIVERFEYGSSPRSLGRSGRLDKRSHKYPIPPSGRRTCRYRGTSSSSLACACSVAR